MQSAIWNLLPRYSHLCCGQRVNSLFSTCCIKFLNKWDSFTYLFVMKTRNLKIHIREKLMLENFQLRGKCTQIYVRACRICFSARYSNAHQRYAIYPRYFPNVSISPHSSIHTYKASLTAIPWHIWSRARFFSHFSIFPLGAVVSV